jgi:orotate phosphoribosyltransferase
MNALIAANLHRIDRSKFDCIVGIPRSGMIPAAIIATHLQMPLADPVGFGQGIVHGRSGRAVSAGRRVLLVDDSCNKGRAMARAASLLPKGTRITRLAIFGPYQVEPSIVCDMWFEIVQGPRAFAWNMQKHRRLPRWAFDFDGVICRDCTKHENDDGPRYKEFLKSVEPLFIPQRPIGHIVTGRAEKYRSETEAWLQRHGVQFEHLHMTPFHTKQERMNAMRFAGGRGGWKAGIAKGLGVEFFIESCPKQAGIIAREAQIPVWCTRTQSLA